MLKVLYLVLQDLPKSDIAYVIGSGPKEFDNNLANDSAPIFYLNDAVRFASCNLPPRYNRFFVSHHLSKFTHLIPSFVTPLYVNKVETHDAEWDIFAHNRNICPDKCLFVNAKWRSEVDLNFLKDNGFLDREKARAGHLIPSFVGSVSVATYLAWLCSDNVIFIGANPNSKSFKHDVQIGGEMNVTPELVLNNQRELVKILNIKTKYI